MNTTHSHGEIFSHGYLLRLKWKKLSDHKLSLWKIKREKETKRRGIHKNHHTLINHLPPHLSLVHRVIRFDNPTRTFHLLLRPRTNAPSPSNSLRLNLADELPSQNRASSRITQAPHLSFFPFCSDNTTATNLHFLFVFCFTPPNLCRH